MFAMITTEEYKELLEAQQNYDERVVELHQIAEELEKQKWWFADFLFFITKGEKKSKWQDGKFEGFDLADKEEIAEYINTHFMDDGRLMIKENDNA
jgi:hypothetical protein